MTLPDPATLQGYCSTWRIGLTWPFGVEVAGVPWTIATDGHGLLAAQRPLEASDHPPAPEEVATIGRTYVERAGTMPVVSFDLAALRAWCRTRFDRACLRCDGTGRVHVDASTCECDRGEGLWSAGHAGRLGNRRINRELVERWLAWLPDGAPIGVGLYGLNPEQPVVFAGERWFVLVMPLRARDVAEGSGAERREPAFAIAKLAQVLSMVAQRGIAT